MPIGIRKQILFVSGMRSNLCRERMIALLDCVDGVIDVSVSLFRARAVVLFTPPCNTDSLVRAAELAGYAALPDTAQSVMKPNCRVRSTNGSRS